MPVQDRKPDKMSFDEVVVVVVAVAVVVVIVGVVVVVFVVVVVVVVFVVVLVIVAVTPSHTHLTTPHHASPGVHDQLAPKGRPQEEDGGLLQTPRHQRHHRRCRRWEVRRS